MGLATIRAELTWKYGLAKMNCSAVSAIRAALSTPASSDTPRPNRPGCAKGGYGWFLIRSLARALTYQRVGDTNCLTFWVPVDHKLPVAELAD